jgi:hypothetical protein
MPGRRFSTLNNTGSCPAAIILLCLGEPSTIHSCPVPVCVCSQPHPTRPHVLSHLLLPCSALAALLAARSLRPSQHALCAPRSAFSAPLVARSLPRCFPISVLTALLAACSLPRCFPISVLTALLAACSLPRCFPISVLAALLAACSLRLSQRALCAPRSELSAPLAARSLRPSQRVLILYRCSYIYLYIVCLHTHTSPRDIILILDVSPHSIQVHGQD